MNANRINAADRVEVAIVDPKGATVYDHVGSGYHNIEQAIAVAYEKYSGIESTEPEHFNDSLEKNPSFFHYCKNPTADDNVIENFVFEVKNLTAGTESRYRINAGGHARLIAEP